MEQTNEPTVKPNDAQNGLSDREKRLLAHLASLGLGVVHLAKHDGNLCEHGTKNDAK